MLTELAEEVVRVARLRLADNPRAYVITFAIPSEQPLRPWTFDQENFRPHQPVTHTIHVRVVSTLACRARGCPKGYWFSVDGKLLSPTPDCPRCLWIWLWETVFELIAMRHMWADNSVWSEVAEGFYNENGCRLEYAETYWTDIPGT